MSKPLVSIIVLGYKNYHYIYEALNSVINQDYENIEIIINNDGADDFNEEEVKKYFSKKKKKNIKNVIIINNKTNIGTVKSINNAIKKSTGEYINFFAADDVFYNKHVVSKFIESFEQLPKDELIVTSQLGMYDLELKKLIQLFLNKKNIEILKNSSPQELFNKMATKCLVAAAGTCYKKKLFSKYGYFDERYLLVEDYSSALKLSRLGVKFNYFDFISFKHRDGGISHGNVGGEQKLNKKYDLDILNIMKHEILPYVNLLDKEQKNNFLEIYKDHDWRFSYKYNFIESSKKERRKFVSENYKLITAGLYKDLRGYLIDQLVGKKFKILLLGLFLLLINFSKIIHSIFGSIQINRLIEFIGLFMILESLILVIYQVYKICWTRIIELIKFVL